MPFHCSSLNPNSWNVAPPAGCIWKAQDLGISKEMAQESRWFLRFDCRILLTFQPLPLKADGTFLVFSPLPAYPGLGCHLWKVGGWIFRPTLGKQRSLDGSCWLWFFLEDKFSQQTSLKTMEESPYVPAKACAQCLLWARYCTPKQTGLVWPTCCSHTWRDTH